MCSGPGTQLPTEAELMHVHRVSRNTVRLALGELVNEGLVTRTPRRGTVVRDRRPLLIYPQRELQPQPAGEPREAFAFAVSQEGRAAEPEHRGLDRAAGRGDRQPAGTGRRASWPWYGAG